jgi:hypothetical protein
MALDEVIPGRDSDRHRGQGDSIEGDGDVKELRERIRIISRLFILVIMLDSNGFAQFLPLHTVTTMSTTSITVDGDSDYDGPSVEITGLRARSGHCHCRNRASLHPGWPWQRRGALGRWGLWEEELRLSYRHPLAIPLWIEHKLSPG